MSSGIDPTRAFLLAKLGASILLRSSVSFADWAVAMRETLKRETLNDDMSDEELRDIHTEAQKLAAQELAKESKYWRESGSQS
jgi:hypothetical protein